jgi:hypothetical protein
MAALTEGDDHGGAASRECSGAAEAGYWRDFFEERAAHREFDGGHSRADAERLAFGRPMTEPQDDPGASPAGSTSLAIIEPTAVATLADTYLVPALIADLGEQAGWRYVEFFTANIGNPHTRRAYARACGQFFPGANNAA